MRGFRACGSASPSSGWSRRRPTWTRAWPAKTTNRTLRISLRAVEAAGVHHADVAEREVVLHGIVGVEATERRGDVARHRPSRAPVARQTQTPADADDVRVERHDQL